MLTWDPHDPRRDRDPREPDDHPARDEPLNDPDESPLEEPPVDEPDDSPSYDEPIRRDPDPKEPPRQGSAPRIPAPRCRDHRFSNTGRHSLLVAPLTQTSANRPGSNSREAFTGVKGSVNP